MRVYLDLNELQGISIQRLERKIRELRTYMPGALVKEKLTVEMICYPDGIHVVIANKEEEENV